MTGSFSVKSRIDVDHPVMNRWVHVVFVFDNFGCALYIDGLKMQSAKWSGGNSHNTTSNEPLYLGFSRSTLSGDILKP